MKRLVFLLSVLSVLTINANAQFWYNHYYANKNLSELNSKELSFLAQKSSQTVTTGIVLTSVGLGMALTGSAIMIYRFAGDFVNWNYSGDRNYNILSGVILTGVVVTIIGVPTIIIGSYRKMGIEDIINDPKRATNLRLSPSIQYNNVLNNYYPGLTVSLRF